MKNDQNKIKEPFPPENTPNPPQIIDPNERNEEPKQEPKRSDKSPSGEAKTSKRDEQPGKEGKKEKLLGESETEITDETTI